MCPGGSSLAHVQAEERLKVLVLSRSYPNNVLQRLGLWVERLVWHLETKCETTVISPSPYVPPLPGFSEYTRFRDIELQSDRNGITVHHPRFLVGPGRSLYNVEAYTYYLSIRGLVDRVHRRFPFKVIHAHFSYPDGIVGAWLGRRYRVPVVITEHAPWRPWMDDSPVVRRHALRAVRESAFVIAVSRSVRDSIAHFAGDQQKVRVIPNGVDDAVFVAPHNGQRSSSNQILFVGIMRPVKGVDILLKAVRRLVDYGRDVKLVIVGEGYYQSYRREVEHLRQMAHDLDLGTHVRFLGAKTQLEVARYMRESALLVLPSRAESFSCVLVEALACGTPVVATKCGGPEDIVTKEVGVLVPTENVDALANAIESVLDKQGTFDPSQLRSYALKNFSWKRIASRTVDLYKEALL